VIGSVRATSPAVEVRVGSLRVSAALGRLAAAWHDAIPSIMSRSPAAAAPSFTETLASPVI
jgi:hypothetical protein